MGGAGGGQNGQDTLANAWFEKSAQFPTTFHGQLAAAHLHPQKGLTFPLRLIPGESERATFEAKELTRVVRLMARMDMADEIKPFILKLYDETKTPAEHALVADLALDTERPDLAVKIARKSIRDGVNLIERGYPIPLEIAGGKPETALLLALMRQESGFRSGAKSHAGARGLMQIMPATARNVAKRLNIPYSKSRLMSDPDYNLTLGRAYIGNLVNRYDGSYVLALAAYNAGPQRVKRWIKENGDPRTKEVDALDWIELIPFNETRTYVQRVLGNLQVYRQRLSQSQVVLMLEDDLHYSN